MATVCVLYPREEGTRFDFDYYEKVHIPMVIERMTPRGLTWAKALRGLASPDGGEPAYAAIGLVSFGSVEQLQAALSSDDGTAVLDDIRNYTDATPVMQVSDQIASV